MKQIYGLVVTPATTVETFRSQAFNAKRCDADQIAIISIAPDNAMLRPEFAEWEKDAFAKERAYAVQVPNLNDPALQNVTVLS